MILYNVQKFISLRPLALIIKHPHTQSGNMYWPQFINPRRACAARVTVLGLCVCLSVTTFSATARNNAPNKIYQRLQWDMSKALKMALKCFVQELRRYLPMRLSRPFFVTLVSMRIPARGHVVCSLLERRAVVPT